MKVKYEEDIVIVPRLDGTFICKLTWRDHSFQKELPRGIERLPLKEFRMHLKKYVIPNLRLKLLKVQRDALVADDVPPEACIPVKQLSESDVDNLERAEAKRSMRAEKKRHNKRGIP